MLFHATSLDGENGAAVGALNGKFVTHIVVGLCHLLVCGCVGLAVLAGVRPLPTLTGLVGLSMPSVHDPTAARVNAGNVYKLTPVQLVLECVRPVEVALDVLQLSCPRAAVWLGGAEHVQVEERSAERVFGHEREVVSVAERAVLAHLGDGLDAHAAKLVATATNDTRVPEDLETHGALGLDVGRRRVNQLTVVPPALLSAHTTTET